MNPSIPLDVSPVMARNPERANSCQSCGGIGETSQILEGQGIVRGNCPTCLGNTLRRPLPHNGQKAVLMYQGQVDATVEAFSINGMMVIPADEEGVVYVTRRDAMRFFGLFEAPSDALLQIQLLRDQININEKLLAERKPPLRPRVNGEAEYLSWGTL